MYRMCIRPQFRQEIPDGIPDNLPTDREVGRPICACNKTGKLSLGRQAQGRDAYSVEVPLNCPSGSSVVGVWHTHPGGRAEPSQADIRTAQRIGLRHLCITVPGGETRCHIVE
jgi:hypothetical protein